MKACIVAGGLRACAADGLPTTNGFFACAAGPGAALGLVMSDERRVQLVHLFLLLLRPVHGRSGSWLPTSTGR
jgi:hypothetical protein